MPTNRTMEDLMKESKPYFKTPITILLFFISLVVVFINFGVMFNHPLQTATPAYLISLAGLSCIAWGWMIWGRASLIRVAAAFSPITLFAISLIDINQPSEFYLYILSPLAIIILITILLSQALHRRRESRSSLNNE